VAPCGALSGKTFRENQPAITLTRRPSRSNDTTPSDRAKSV
jgi:hypothetical protein